MKQIILLLLIIVGSNLYGAELYSFGGFFSDVRRDNNWIDEDYDYFHTELGVGVENQFNNFRLFLETSIETDMIKNPDTLNSFSPFYEEYYFRTGLEISLVTITYEHMCSHAIDYFDEDRNDTHDRVGVYFDSRKLE